MLNNKVVQSREQFPSLSPNDEAQLVEVLTKSLNGGTEEQKIAENTLHQVEKRNGYLSLLLVSIIIFICDFLKPLNAIIYNSSSILSHH